MNDTIYGGGGVDTINGGDGDDVLFGGTTFDDVMNGGAGQDIIEVVGDGLLYGDGDDDTFVVLSNSVIGSSDGGDTAFGGTGTDTFDVSNETGVEFIMDKSAGTITSGSTTDNFNTIDIDTLDLSGNDFAFDVDMTTGLTDAPGESLINFENLILATATIPLSARAVTTPSAATTAMTVCRGARARIF